MSRYETPAERSERIFQAKMARIRDRAQEERDRLGVCACGHPLEKCAPERCSHPYARDAMWGNT